MQDRPLSVRGDGHPGPLALRVRDSMAPPPPTPVITCRPMSSEAKTAAPKRSTGGRSEVGHVQLQPLGSGSNRLPITPSCPAQTCTITPFMAQAYRHIKRQNDSRPKQSEKRCCSPSPSLARACSCRWLSHHPIAPKNCPPTSTKSHLWHKHSVAMALCKAKPQPIMPHMPHNICLWGIPNPRPTRSQNKINAPFAPAIRTDPPSLGTPSHHKHGKGAGGGCNTTNGHRTS